MLNNINLGLIRNELRFGRKYGVQVIYAIVNSLM